MTAGIISAYLNIPLIHIGGGDRVVGNIDDGNKTFCNKISTYTYCNQ